ncbi:MAG: hypothetical protein EAZ92_00110 [Candidatus Kapaibacterium sp.]|nr:MAG: hypothetical protein EAZ92_00110 [Candidatus Kapabacteria bacterium]
MNTLLATHEDLLVKYMDGMLSGEEEQRFNALLTSSPAFADEVRAIANFDDFLDDSNASKHWENQVDMAFLSEMQQNLAQVVVTGAAASAASGAATSAAATSIPAKSAMTGSILANITASTASKIIVASLVCASLGAGLWQWNKGAQERQIAAIEQRAQSSQGVENLAAPSSAQQNPAEETAKPVASTPSQSPENTRLSERSAVVSPAQKSDNSAQEQAQTVAQPSAPAAQAPPQEQEARSDASIHGASKFRETIDQYTQQLSTYEQSGEATSAVITQKRLGMILREAAQYEESAQYFAKALKGAQNLKLREVYGEILAEQAMLFRATGKSEKALQTLQEAVGILQETGASSLAKWKRELERLEKK